MISRIAVPRAATPRSVLRLLAVLALVATLGVVTAEAATRSHKPKSSSSTHRASTEKVDINSASLKELEELPGVGTVMAQRIMAGRPYKSVPDLKRAGIPAGTVNGLAGKVKAGRGTAGRSESAPRAAIAEQRRAEPKAPAPEAAPEARKAPAQRTFFGIPIGAPARTESKPEPAASGKQREEPIGAARAATTERATQEPPSKGMVWVNLDSKVYHYEGDHWYGNTKRGKFMWEDQAIREGCRAAKKGGKPSGD